MIDNWEEASKRPHGPFGTKPARASAFISVSILLDMDALAGIAKPARASPSDRNQCSILSKADASAYSSIDIPMNAEALAGFDPNGP